MLIIFLVIFILFILLILGIRRMFKSKKKTVKILAIISTIGLLSITYFIYDAFYPNESFYIEEWERNTDLPFPKSADFEWKDATYPDQHNDYTSTAIIIVTKDDFDNLYKLARTNNSIITDSESNGYKGILTQFLPSGYKNENLIKEYFYSFTRNSFKIGFGKDSKTIIFQRHSS